MSEAGKSPAEEGVIDLMAALERSVREAREARQAARCGGCRMTPCVCDLCPVCGGPPHDAYDCEAP